MDTIGKKVRLAYYEASDGPRVVFFGPLDADFQSLEAVFEEMSRSTGPLEFGDLQFVWAFGVRLIAYSTGSVFADSHGKPRGIRRRPGDGEPVFEWRRTAEGWDYLARLIDSVVRSPISGHQYLTSYPSEDAIVVVSKGEYGDDVLDL
jgi:hypothetical protein